MATSNQGQGRRKDGREGNHAAHEKESNQPVEQLRSGAEMVGNRLREGYDTAREAVERGGEGAQEMVASYPASSLLLSFGVGFGVGLLLTTVLTRREETWAERYLPDSLSHLRIPDQMSRAAHQIPDSLQSSFQSLADSIRDMPNAIARMMPRH
jgi:hypothetical protein